MCRCDYCEMCYTVRASFKGIQHECTVLKSDKLAYYCEKADKKMREANPGIK